MRAALVVVMVVDFYVLIYYRLLVRFYYERTTGRRETTFGALFSLPPYRVLPERGRRYAKRYWLALSLLICTVLILAWHLKSSFARLA